MLNNGSNALVDKHTRFLMRFDNDFKVDGYPSPNIDILLLIRGAMGGRMADIVIGKWYHIAIVRVNNTLYGFVDGKLSVSLPCFNRGLRYKNIDFNRQRDGSNRGSFVIDNFRISDVARWTSDFNPPK